MTMGRRSTPIAGGNPTGEVSNLVAAVEERQDQLRERLEGLVLSKISGLESVLCSKITCIEELAEERYSVTQKQLDGVELRRAEYKADTKSAVEAAFAAARDAVREQAAASDKAIAKSESAFTSQVASVEGTVSDLKDRIAKLETQRQAVTDNRVDGRASIGTIVGVVGAMAAFITLIVTMFMMKGAG